MLSTSLVGLQDTIVCLYKIQPDIAISNLLQFPDGVQGSLPASDIPQFQP